MAGNPHFGALTQPRRGGSLETLLTYGVWAADNDCYNQGPRFDLEAYLKWLTRFAPIKARCLFASAPDVVGDAQATWQRSAPVLERIRALGYPAALVGQDGMENLAIDWKAFDVLFLGGSTEWKLSEAARDLVTETKRQGKSTHMGRVNSLRRLKIAHGWGCDSVDGTKIGFKPSEVGPMLVRWMTQIHQ